MNCILSAKLKISPYVAKIKASGADSGISRNWGNDLSLLVKAGKEAGLDVNYFTYYAGIVGTTGTIGQAGIDKSNKFQCGIIILKVNSMKV